MRSTAAGCAVCGLARGLDVRHDRHPRGLLRSFSSGHLRTAGASSCGVSCDDDRRGARDGSGRSTTSTDWSTRCLRHGGDWVQILNGISNGVAVSHFSCDQQPALGSRCAGSSVADEVVPLRASVRRRSRLVDCPRDRPISDAVWILGLLTMAFLPVAIGTAILPLRLYEIDRIVSRGGRLRSRHRGRGRAVHPCRPRGGVAAGALHPDERPCGGGLDADRRQRLQRLRRRIQGLVDRRIDRAKVDGDRSVALLVERLRAASSSMRSATTCSKRSTHRSTRRHPLARKSSEERVKNADGAGPTSARIRRPTNSAAIAGSAATAARNASSDSSMNRIAANASLTRPPASSSWSPCSSIASAPIEATFVRSLAASDERFLPNAASSSSSGSSAAATWPNRFASPPSGFAPRIDTDAAESWSPWRLSTVVVIAVATRLIIGSAESSVEATSSTVDPASSSTVAVRSRRPRAGPRPPRPGPARH